jgi:uncharacterized SAM-binding protein YcdF (DUF218 family)
VFRGRSFPKILLALVVCGVLAAATHTLWLPWLGYVLIRDDGPAKADIAVVLAGGYTGSRLEKAAELVKQGWVPKVLVSGPPLFDVHETDVCIPMMMRRGYPASWFIACPNSALSTREEAWVILGELKRRQVKSFILVTSNYHSGRARRIYRAVERAMGGGPPFRVVAATDPFFDPADWWKNREGQKAVFLEWSKSLAAALGN